jgi:hypothetical protein
MIAIVFCVLLSIVYIDAASLPQCGAGDSGFVDEEVAGCFCNTATGTACLPGTFSFSQTSYNKYSITFVAYVARKNK